MQGFVRNYHSHLYLSRDYCYAGWLQNVESKTFVTYINAESQ